MPYVARKDMKFTVSLGRGWYLEGCTHVEYTAEGLSFLDSLGKSCVTNMPYFIVQETDVEKT